MGIEHNAVKAILKMKSKGIEFPRVATIGRQGLHIKERDLRKIFAKFNIEFSEKISQEPYSEFLFEYLGAKSVDSFDYSDYEGATFIHDMNSPIADEHKDKYDLVFDGGTLEHVFNFPSAIKNCMEMVKKGGLFISITTCNNFSGHGFYQFSPELFFRIFDVENGFEVLYLGISVDNVWYSIQDPKKIKQRAIFKNNHETYMIVVARKTDNREIFRNIPMQSDYVSLWEAREPSRVYSGAIMKMKRFFGRFLKDRFIKYDKNAFKKEKI